MTKKQLNYLFLFLILSVSYIIGFYLRTFPLAEWANEAYFLNGERILATHDAYYQLSASQGFSKYDFMPLAGLLKILEAILPIPLGTIAFYIPIVLAPLSAFPVIILLWHMGYKWASLCAGIFIVTSPAYYMRTQAGFCDTDVLNLFFPLLIVCLLVELSRKVYKVDHKQNQTYPEFAMRYIFSSLVIGFCSYLYIKWYPSGKSVLMAILFCALPVLLFYARKTLTLSLLGFLTILITWYNPPLGLFFALLSFSYTYFLQPKIGEVTSLRTRYIIYTIISIIILIACVYNYDHIFEILNMTQHKMQTYGNQSGLIEQDGFLLPNMYATILEVQNSDILGLLPLFAPNPFLALLGIFGMLIAIYKEPRFIIFLSLIIIGFSSLYLGTRFSMYTPALAIGFAMLPSFLIASQRPYFLNFKFKFMQHKFYKISTYLVTILLCLSLSFYTVQVANKFLRTIKPSPVLPNYLASSMKELQTKTTPHSSIWIWWDWGFAVNYFAHRDNVADGHRNTATFVYPLAIAMLSDSSIQSSNIMRAHGSQSYPISQHDDYTGYNSNFMTNLMRKSAKEATEYLISLRDGSQSFANEHDQYIICHFDIINYLRTISEVANIDLSTGKSTSLTPLIFSNVDAPKLDADNNIGFNDNQYFELAGYAILNQDGTVTKELLKDDLNNFAVYSAQTRTGYIMHRKMYESTILRLLLSNKDEKVEGFELVLDNSPFVKVYKAIEEGS